jgi:hypothetical protein
LKKAKSNNDLRNTVDVFGGTGMTFSYVVLDEQGIQVGLTTWAKPRKLLPGQRLSARFTRIDTDHCWPIMTVFNVCDCEVEVITLPNNKEFSEYKHIVTVVGDSCEKVAEAINQFCREKLKLRQEIPTGLPRLRTIHERLFFLMNYIFRGKTTITIENPEGYWDIY